MSNLKQKLVVFSGAGISAESGINTFRDSGGLWENYKIEDVATPEAWMRNPSLVQDFYNMRRKQVLEAEPNTAHKAIFKLEKKYDVQIITQNIDDLHERAGSSKILHLHGLITKAQSSKNPNLTYPIKGWKIEMHETCELGSPLRPHVVWFGEAVPNMDLALRLVQDASIFICIGTSLNVYPAANTIFYLPKNCIKILIDPKADELSIPEGFEIIKKNAIAGMQEILKLL